MDIYVCGSYCIQILCISQDVPILHTGCRCHKYRGILPTSVTPADVYVAINSQYHDYAELFKNWFGNDIEQKVVESAIVFWFKDADAKSENKLMEYFREY